MRNPASKRSRRSPGRSPLSRGGGRPCAGTPLSCCGPSPVLQSPATNAKIMLAIVANKVQLWQRILDGHELVFAMTLRDAMQRLADEDDLRMVIIGVHFDESRMFTLLDDIRACPKYRNI